MSKEKWIEDIIQSGKELSQAPVNPFLATRVEARIRTLEEQATTPVVAITW